MAASDVRVYGPATATGGIRSGPLGTALPTDTATALDAALVASGYVGEDGLSMTENRTTNKIRAWGGDAVRTVQTEHDVTFSWTYLETNTEVLKDLHGDANVTETAPTITLGTLRDVLIKGEALPVKARVFDMKDGDALCRVVVPNGQITEVGDVQFVHTDATGRQVTMEAFPDNNGVKAFIYSDDGVTT